MPDLIAQGEEIENRWRRSLSEGKVCTLGRSVGSWSTPWDDRISRRHIEFCWNNGLLEVTKLADARNPIFIRGRKKERFVIKPGEHFVIGGTTFTVADEHVDLSVVAPRPVTEQTFSPQLLQRHRFRHADQRIEVLSRLPEIVSSAANDVEMLVRVVSVLLTGIPRASSAAVVAVHDQADGEDRVEVLHWDRRMLSSEPFQPSEKLIFQAVESGESVVHAWSGAGANTEMTQGENVDWAFCTPLRGKACQGWAIYLSGGFSSASASGSDQTGNPDDLRDDLKFTELASGMIGSLREMRLLQRDQTVLGQFLSPVVVEAISAQEQSPDAVLAPREAEVSVLFCDLRGFSRTSERAANDLHELLNRVSGALGVMTHHILQQGGVVGDFHGDAAMGFWGWPLAQEDAAERACRAALGIRAEFEAAAQQEGHHLTDFRVGIGVASGRAVAGKIGTIDQVKVTVFGPVVNLASRLEEMTKTLRAPILLDEATASAVRDSLPTESARIRRVAKVRPYGLETSLEVSELLPPAEQYPQLTDQHIAAYEAAVDALLARDWDQAFELLHQVPAEDRVKDFLTVFIAQHNRTPPEDWDGVISLTAK